MRHLLPFDGFVNEEKTIHQIDARFVIDATKKKVTYTPLLHHFTTLKGLESILKSNTLQTGDDYEEGKGAVSLTYNAELPDTLEELDLTCRISLDKTKLEKAHVLVPYLFVPKKKKFSWECKDEMEEQVREDIPKLSAYVVDIAVIGSPEKVKALQKLYPKLDIHSVKEFD